MGKCDEMQELLNVLFGRDGVLLGAAQLVLLISKVEINDVTVCKMVPIKVQSIISRTSCFDKSVSATYVFPLFFIYGSIF